MSKIEFKTEYHQYSIDDANNNGILDAGEEVKEDGATLDPQTAAIALNMLGGPVKSLQGANISSLRFYSFASAEAWRCAYDGDLDGLELAIKKATMNGVEAHKEISIDKERLATLYRTVFEKCTEKAMRGAKSGMFEYTRAEAEKAKRAAEAFNTVSDQKIDLTQFESWRGQLLAFAGKMSGSSSNTGGGSTPSAKADSSANAKLEKYLKVEKDCNEIKKMNTQIKKLLHDLSAGHDSSGQGIQIKPKNPSWN